MNTETNPKAETSAEGHRSPCWLAFQTPRDIFQVVAAAIILIWLGSGVFDLVDAALSATGTYEVAPGRAKFLAASGSIRIFFSCVMLRNVSAIAAWVFPRQQSGETSKDSSPIGD